MGPRPQCCLLLSAEYRGGLNLGQLTSSKILDVHSSFVWSNQEEEVIAKSTAVPTRTVVQSALV